MTFYCLRFGVKKERAGVRSIDQSRCLIGGKIEGREEGRIRGFDRAVGVRVREGFEGIIDYFFRRYKVISYVNISATIRLNPRAKLYQPSLRGAP